MLSSAHNTLSSLFQQQAPAKTPCVNFNVTPQDGTPWPLTLKWLPYSLVHVLLDSFSIPPVSVYFVSLLACRFPVGLLHQKLYSIEWELCLSYSLLHPSAWNTVAYWNMYGNGVAGNSNQSPAYEKKVKWGRILIFLKRAMGSILQGFSRGTERKLRLVYWKGREVMPEGPRPLK
jgi:hypothetical protein